MSSPLEHAVDNMSGEDLEKLAPEVLREQGYNVKASGEHGRDGGWDAFIETPEKNGVAHASKQESWRRKLRSDAESASELEEERDWDFDVFVFITNRQPTGQQELDLRDEIKEEYGWSLDVLHRRDLISTLGTDRPDLADRILGVDIRKRSDNLKEIESLVEDRISKIRYSKGAASELYSNQFAVLHLMPNGMTTKDFADSFDVLPAPPAFALEGYGKPKTKGRAKYTVDSRFDEDETQKYGYIHMNGLFEGVTTDLFYPTVTEDVQQEGMITNRSDGKGLDTKFCKCLSSGMSILNEMGVSCPVYLFFTLMGVEGHSMTSNHKVGQLSTFDSDVYTTNPVTIEDLQSDSTQVAKKPLDELWRELGRGTGSPNYSEDGWIGSDI